MTRIYTFSVLTNGQHLSFAPDSDRLTFDVTSYGASSVRLSLSNSNLKLAQAGKSVWLDGVVFGQLSLENITFSNGSHLLLGDGTTALVADWYGQHYQLAAFSGGHQVWGLGGADFVQTGNGQDYIVGNDALTPLNHVSRSGSTGSPNSSFNPTISADGRFVAFQGGWTRFGSPSNSSTDVFVKELSSGSITNEHKTASGEFGLSGSGRPVISADGNWLAFWSGSELQPKAWGSIYLASTQSAEVKVVSSTSAGVLANGANDWPDLSADGRYVAFQSHATNLAPGGNGNYQDIFVKDMLTGSLQRAASVEANHDCRDAKISGDGRFVVFSSAATNLTATKSGAYAGQTTDIYVWDRSDGSLTNITGGKGGRFDALNPDVGYDEAYGGVVVFQTEKALVAGDTNNAIDVYAFNLVDGSFTRISTRADGGQHAVSSYAPSVSGDGRWVVFRSGDANVPLVAGDRNGYDDIFVRDLYTGAIALVSRPPGAQANQVSGNPEISAGGDWIVFESSASNLAATDANGTTTDVFRASNPLLRDTLEGGSGDDVYVIARNDIITEKANGGIDLVQSSISYTLGGNLENLTLSGTRAINGTGNALNNVLTGNTANNVLSGGAGADKLLGGAGADKMLGGSGNDTYHVDNSGDRVHETTTTTSVIDAGGTDTVYSYLTAYTLGIFMENGRIMSTGAANLTGNSLNNVIRAGKGSNVVSSGSGNDTLYGDAGNDLLRGGTGNDILYGGTGKDFFRFDTALGTSATPNIDRIRDFSVADDTIQLENAIFTRFGTGTTGTINAAYFKANTTGLAQDSNDYIVYEKDTGALFYDANGSAAGGSIQIALIGVNLALTSADFVLV